MAQAVEIKETTDSPAINIALDTIGIGKQALVFANTKLSAEATAEKIALNIKKASPELDELSARALKVLSTPTKQCRRLALCLKHGVAFHHAGLPSGQRSLIEDSFRSGVIRVICSTPTLAFGINLPAFRTVIKDLKRYGGRWGMQYIPTLEYHQMAGRAGRPDFKDSHGEAICIAGTESEAEEILERYIRAGPENIYSKLAVEPVLRTYCLSLIAGGFAGSRKELVGFFERSFYGHQFRDMKELEAILSRIIGKLIEWGFLATSDFMTANRMQEDSLVATRLGERVAQLYIDPYTANYIISALKRARGKVCTEFSFLSMVSGTLEIRPRFRVRRSDGEAVEDFLAEHADELIIAEPSVFDPDYEDYLDSIKTTLVFSEWMDEKSEDFLLDTYSVTPGEFRTRMDIADWLFYATDELAAVLSFKELLTPIRKTRFRLKHGVREELAALVRVKGIGRKRARRLYRNGIRDVGDIKKTDISLLGQLVGRQIAARLKGQVGEKEQEAVPTGKRKGQMGLGKY